MQVGRVRVDVCQGGCGGIWFDAFELQQVDDETEAAGQPLLKIERDERLVIDRNRKRQCPRCPGVKLHRHFFSAKRKVEVDQCPGCAGYWLDAGELAQIRAERAEKSGSEAEHAGISIDVIRYIYRMRSEHRPAS